MITLKIKVYFELVFREEVTVEKNMLLSRKIEGRVKELGLTRQDFARHMDVQPSSITKWLSGKHNFTLETIYEIERRLSLSLMDLSAAHKMPTMFFNLRASSTDMAMSNAKNILNHLGNTDGSAVKIIFQGSVALRSVVKYLEDDSQQDEFANNFDFLGLIKHSKNP